MICMRCDRDLADCKCPDREEQWNAISNSQHVHFGKDYRQRIQASIDKAKADAAAQQAKAE